MVHVIEEIISILLLLSSLTLPNITPTVTEPRQRAEIAIQPKWQVSDPRLDVSPFWGSGQAADFAKNVGNQIVIPFVDTYNIDTYGPDQLVYTTRFWFFDKETGENTFTEWDYALTEWLFDETAQRYYIAGVYKATGDELLKENALFCFDKKGNELWHQKLNGGVDELLLTNGSLYIRITTGIQENGERSVLRMDAASGDILDTQDFGSRMIGWMTPYKNTVKICLYDFYKKEIEIADYNQNKTLQLPNNPIGVKYVLDTNKPIVKGEDVYFATGYYRKPFVGIMKMKDTVEKIITFKNDYAKDIDLFTKLFGYKESLFILRDPLFDSTPGNNYIMIDCYDLEGTFLSSTKVNLDMKFQGDTWYGYAWMDGDTIYLWVDDSGSDPANYSLFEIPVNSIAK